MACTCKPKHKSSMSVRIRQYKRKTGPVKSHRRHSTKR